MNTNSLDDLTVTCDNKKFILYTSQRNSSHCVPLNIAFTEREKSRSGEQVCEEEGKGRWDTRAAVDTTAVRILAAATARAGVWQASRSYRKQGRERRGRRQGGCDRHAARKTQ